EATLRLVVEGIGIHRLELPLPRRVIHERSQADARVITKVFEMFDHVGRRDFAAQMQQMFGAETPFAFRLFDGVGESAHFSWTKTVILFSTKAQAVEHRCDA